MVNFFPRHIKTIGIVAPSGPISCSALHEAITLVEKAGLTVKCYCAPASNAESYLSADLHTRLTHFHACWQDKDVDAVLCARGGYGAAHLLPHLDWQLLKSRSLPLLGFSDITALHLAMHTKGCRQGIAAPMAIHYPELANDPFSQQWLTWSLANQTSKAKTITNLTVIKSGQANGPILPANLTVLASLCGTPYLPDFSGTILILEDIDEAIYALDRNLMQLALNNIISKCAAVIFGKFNECGSDGDLNRLFTTFQHYVDGPVLSGFPFGHTLPIISLPVGIHAEVESDHVRLIPKPPVSHF